MATHTAAAHHLAGHSRTLRGGKSVLALALAFPFALPAAVTAVRAHYRRGTDRIGGRRADRGRRQQFWLQGYGMDPVGVQALPDNARLYREAGQVRAHARARDDDVR